MDFSARLAEDAFAILCIFTLVAIGAAVVEMSPWSVPFTLAAVSFALVALAWAIATDDV